MRFRSGGLRGGDTSSVYEFLVDALNGIAGAHASAMGFGQGVDGEALRDIGVHPGGEFGCDLDVFGDDLFEAGLGAGQIGAGEDGADICCDVSAHLQAGYISLGVLWEVELVALPRQGGGEGVAGVMSAAGEFSDSGSADLLLSHAAFGRAGCHCVQAGF